VRKTEGRAAKIKRKQNRRERRNQEKNRKREGEIK
jgi:hypothetical protein